MRTARGIVSPFPIGPEPTSGRYTRGTVQVAERLIGPTPHPQAREPIRASLAAGLPSIGVFQTEFGPRNKIRYILPAIEAGRRRRMANTDIGLSFFTPRSVAKIAASAGVHAADMARRGRYTKVLRNPRGSRAPRVYGEA